MKYIGQDPAVLDNFATAVANGAISSGDPCIIESAGTVAAVGVTGDPDSKGTVYDTTYASTDSGIVYDPDQDKYLLVFVDENDNNYLKAVVISVSGTAITYGTYATLVSQYCDLYPGGITYDTTANKTIISFRDRSTNYAYGMVLTISGTSVSAGTAAALTSGTAVSVACLYDSTNNKTLFVYRTTSDSGLDARVGTVSGTSLSYGTEVNFDSGSVSYNIGMAYDSDLSKFVITYPDSNNSNTLSSTVGTISGTSVSFGSVVASTDTTTYQLSLAYDDTANKILIVYRDSGNSNYGTAVVGTVSGTSISYGTPAVFESQLIGANDVFYSSNSGKCVLIYDTPTPNDMKAVSVTISGTTPSFGTAFDLVTTEEDHTEIQAAFDASTNTSVVKFYGPSSNYDLQQIVYKPSSETNNITAENFIGFADKDYTNGADAVIQAKGAVNDKQTSLTAGQSYFVQTNGTLGTTAGNPSVFAGTAVSATQLIVKG